MGTRKKKDRRKNKRMAKEHNAGGQVEKKETSAESCQAGCDACPSPCVKSVSNVEFDRWLAQSGERAAKRERQFREFTETPVGWVMLNANGNRRAAHLLTPAELLATMPADPADKNDYTPISLAWKEWSDGGRRGDPAEFVACGCSQAGLGDLWNTFAGYEQFYMDVWSLLNAEASRDSMTIEPPKDGESMKAALSAALVAFRRAYAEQQEDDPRYLYAYDTIHIADDPRIAALLEKVSEGSEEFCFGESDRRGGAFHFREASGASDHTATAAGYRAAVKVLRSYGIGCAQWSMWD